MNIAIWFIAAVAAYLVSGVNPAILLSRAIYKQDIRTVGSKNPGFTNFKRVYGWKFAWLVLFIDVTKAVLPCLGFAIAFREIGVLDTAQYQTGSAFTGSNFQLGAAFTGLFAMLGHAYPVWYRFKGGKAFLVAASAIWFIDWRVALIASGVFLLLLFTVQIMSVSSLTAALSCPVSLALFGFAHPVVMVCCVLSVILLFWRHKPNLVRLAHGKEPRFKLFGKNKVAKDGPTEKPSDAQAAPPPENAPDEQAVVSRH